MKFRSHCDAVAVFDWCLVMVLKRYHGSPDTDLQAHNVMVMIASTLDTLLVCLCREYKEAVRPPLTAVPTIRHPVHQQTRQ